MNFVPGGASSSIAPLPPVPRHPSASFWERCSYDRWLGGLVSDDLRDLICFCNSCLPYQDRLCTARKEP